MSKDANTPRLYLLRHGATEWSLSGRYTGVSDIPLLPEGEDAVRKTAKAVFGSGKLIDPGKLRGVYVSPRGRARRTLELLLEEGGGEEGRGGNGRALKEKVKAMTVETERVGEWRYGDYEGLLPEELKGLRRERGYDRERAWDIWVDGAEGQGSEGPEDVRRRVDGVIKEVVEMQGRWMKERKDGGKHETTNSVGGGEKGCDVLIVAHGHILRAMVKRWLKLEMGSKVELMLEPGGVCGLSYAHGNVEERAVLVGMSFPQLP